MSIPELVGELAHETLDLKAEVGNLQWKCKQIEYEREKLEAENAKLRELLQRLLTEYRYMRARPRRVYLQHEARMRAIEEEMCELGIMGERHE